jgi:nucleoside-diphosphate-sugar epimerase
MMTTTNNIVLLGGNGYLGRNVTKEWMKHDATATFYVLSRSGKNELSDSKIKNIAVDVTNYDNVNAVLPKKVDYIVDFIGAPEKDPKVFEQLNIVPARIMKQIAEEKKVTAMGFIGGVLGPKTFTTMKKQMIKELSQSKIKLGYVEPTLVYGAGRKDSMTKMVPLLNVFGLFSKKLKPVTVTEVARELVANILK